MTTPAGDLPDWQTLVSPAVLGVGALGSNIGNNLIFQSATPFRIWGLAMSAAFGAQAAYGGGLSFAFFEIQDGAGNVLLSITLGVGAANQCVNDTAEISLPGLTPALSGGFYTINLNINAGSTNLFATGAASLFYSQP